MKKSICLLCTALVVSSFCGCTARNEALRNNQGNLQGQSIINRPVAGNLKDGTYTGESDASTNSIRQAATVEVSNGKIVSVALKNLDVKGFELSDSAVYSLGGVNNFDVNGTGNPGVNNTPGSPAGNNVTGNNLGNTNVAPTNPNNGVTSTNPNPTAGTATVESIGQSKAELANAIVQNQGTNVSVSTGDTNMINNWKIAVDRALSRARY